MKEKKHVHQFYFCFDKDRHHFILVSARTEKKDITIQLVTNMEISTTILAYVSFCSSCEIILTRLVIECHNPSYYLLTAMSIMQ